MEEKILEILNQELLAYSTYNGGAYIDMDSKKDAVKKIMELLKITV